MQITLRRANKLRVKLEHRVNEVAQLLHFTDRTYSVYTENIPSKVVEHRDAVLQTMARHGGLNNVFTSLRESIAKANVEHGISLRLAQSAGLERERNILRGLIGAKMTPTVTEIEAIIAAKKTVGSAASYRQDENVSFGIMTDMLLLSMTKRLAEIDLELSALEDEREGMNAKVRIELSAIHQSILTAESLL